MKTFEELKEELLIRAKNAGACQAGYAMGLRSNTKSDLLKAITENWFWVLRSADCRCQIPGRQLHGRGVIGSRYLYQEYP